MRKIIKHRREVIKNAQFMLDVLYFRNNLYSYLRKCGYTKKKSQELFKKILTTNQ